MGMIHYVEEFIPNIAKGTKKIYQIMEFEPTKITQKFVINANKSTSAEIF